MIWGGGWRRNREDDFRAMSTCRGKYTCLRVTLRGCFGSQTTVPVSGDLYELEVKKTVLLALSFFSGRPLNTILWMPVSVLSWNALCCQEAGSFLVENLVKIERVDWVKGGGMGIP